VVTHRHFDHAGGLAPLLTALAAVPEARLTVYAPRDTLRALHALLALTIPGVEDWLGARLDWRELAMGAPVRMRSAVVTPVAVDLLLARGEAEVNHVHAVRDRPLQPGQEGVAAALEAGRSRSSTSAPRVTPAE